VKRDKTVIYVSLFTVAMLVVAAGLVDRRTATHTRREIALRLTDRGRATLTRYDDLRLTGLHACLDNLPDAERGQALAGLRALGGATGVTHAP